MRPKSICALISQDRRHETALLPYMLSVMIVFTFILIFQQYASAAPRKNSVAEYQSLNKKLSKSGKLRVIVQLARAFPSDASIKNKSFKTLQRADIRSAQDTVLSQLQTAKLGVIRRFKTIPYLAVEVDAADLTRLRQSKEVAYISEDQLFRPTLSESGPIVGADVAADMGFEGNGFSVAILDTGVDSSHPFLGGRVIHEACYSTTSTVYSSSSVCPDGSEAQVGPGAGVNCDITIEGCDHGTHVAGIAAGAGSTFSGMAPGASIISIQVFSRFSGTSCTSAGYTSPCAFSYISDQLSALEHLYLIKDSYNIASINMSLGGGQYFTEAECDLAYPAGKDMFDNLRAAGIAPVAAAGNDGYTDSLGAPACISGVISVGASDDFDNVASYSNSASFLTVLAPGTAIKSSIPGGGYGTKSGTSMATPHVSGAWADLKSKWPNATVDEIQLAFTATGKNILDLRNSLTKPRIQINSATATYKTMSKGFNFTGINNSPTVSDNYSLLQSLGNVDYVSRIERLNRIPIIFETTYYNVSGFPAGDNGILDAGEGWITYANKDFLLRNYSENGCYPTSLSVGVNIVSFPCIKHKVTAFELLSISSDPSGLFMVQRFDTSSGKFNTAILSDSGTISGSDFQINAGESYLLQSRSDILLPVVE